MSMTWNNENIAGAPAPKIKLTLKLSWGSYTHEYPICGIAPGAIKDLNDKFGLDAQSEIEPMVRQAITSRLDSLAESVATYVKSVVFEPIPEDAPVEENEVAEVYRRRGEQLVVWITAYTEAWESIVALLLQDQGEVGNLREQALGIIQKYGELLGHLESRFRSDTVNIDLDGERHQARIITDDHVVMSKSCLGALVQVLYPEDDGEAAISLPGGTSVVVTGNVEEDNAAILAAYVAEVTEGSNHVSPELYTEMIAFLSPFGIDEGDLETHLKTKKWGKLPTNQGWVTIQDAGDPGHKGLYIKPTLKKWCRCKGASDVKEEEGGSVK